MASPWLKQQAGTRGSYEVLRTGPPDFPLYKGFSTPVKFVLYDLPGEYDGYDEEGDAHGLQVLGVLLVKGF